MVHIVVLGIVLTREMACKMRLDISSVARWICPVDTATDFVNNQVMSIQQRPVPHGVS